MADVFVTTTNNQGHTVTLRLDDQRDAERIDYIKSLVRREDLASVDVKPVVQRKPAKAAASKPE